MKKEINSQGQIKCLLKNDLFVGMNIHLKYSTIYHLQLKYSSEESNQRLRSSQLSSEKYTIPLSPNTSPQNLACNY